MKKRLLFTLFCIFFLLSSFLLPAFAEEEESEVSKTATLSEDEERVYLDIETQMKIKPKILVFQGTYCSAHQLKDTTIVQGLNSLLTVSDVDYVAATLHYSYGTRIEKPLKSFTKGTTVKEGDIYRVISQSGNHIIDHECMKLLIDLINENNYRYIVFIVDGGFATGSSGGNNASIFNVKNSIYRDDDGYKVRYKLAELLNQTHVVYLTSSPTANDVYMNWDSSNKSYSYQHAKAFWDDTYLQDSYTTEGLKYLNAHLFLDGMAFYCPEYYLANANPETGRLEVTNPPDIRDIGIDKNKLVPYEVASTVVNKLDDIGKSLIPVTISIEDALANGLTYEDGTVEYYDDTLEKWIECTEEEATIALEEGGLVTALIDNSEQKFTNKRIKFHITTIPDESFGLDGEPTTTNEGCTITYEPENEDDPPLEIQTPDSPTVTFTAFPVHYDPGEHGELTGKSIEYFKAKKTDNVTTGSSVEAFTHYIHIGWICDKDVVLTDGTSITARTLMSNEQIAEVRPTEEITFIAQYRLEIFHVTYVVKGDEKWGLPTDSKTPEDKTDYFSNDPVTVKDRLSSEDKEAYDSEMKISVKGNWGFDGWDKEDFNIIEDTEIHGKWSFIPSPLHVTYVVNGDKKWGIPTDSKTPIDEKNYKYEQEVIVEEDLSSKETTAYDSELKINVKGSWKFNSWDKEDFKIVEDTEIYGSWEFTPDPLHVTYVVEGDEKWGIPTDSVTPVDTTDYQYRQRVKVKDDLTTAEKSAYNPESKIYTKGNWKFSGWDKEDFDILEDAVIYGEWIFTPDKKVPVVDTSVR